MWNSLAPQRDGGRDRSELRALGETHGLQNRIVEASYAAASADEAFHLLAMIVATLCAVPWGWYFLLRRLGELRAALAGNVPDR